MNSYNKQKLNSSDSLWSFLVPKQKISLWEPSYIDVIELTQLIALTENPHWILTVPAVQMSLTPFLANKTADSEKTSLINLNTNWINSYSPQISLCSRVKLAEELWLCQACVTFHRGHPAPCFYSPFQLSDTTMSTGFSITMPVHVMREGAYTAAIHLIS